MSTLGSTGFIACAYDYVVILYLLVFICILLLALFTTVSQDLRYARTVANYNMLNNEKGE